MGIKAGNYSLMAQCLRAIMSMAWSMDRGYSTTLMGHTIRGSSMRISSLGMECSNSRMETTMRGSGYSIGCMVRAYLSGRMAKSTRGDSDMATSMAMDRWSSQMEMSLLDSMRMDVRMGRGSGFITMRYMRRYGGMGMWWWISIELCSRSMHIYILCFIIKRNVITTTFQICFQEPCMDLWNQQIDGVLDVT